MQNYIKTNIILLLLIIFTTSLYAEEYSAKIKRVIELYDSMEYEKCLKEINQLEGYKYNMKKEELVELYKYKAFIYILSDRKALADGVIKEIYEIDPDFTLSPSVSPKLREPFAKIKKDLKKEDKSSSTRVIEAKPINPSLNENVRVISKEILHKKEENFFKKNIIPISILGTGVALLIPGLIVRLNAASEADDYRQKLSSAPRDELGNIIGITKEEAQSKQDDIDGKVVLGNTLMTLGSIGIVGGVASYFILDKIRKENNRTVSIIIDNGKLLFTTSYNF
ncbi:MAG: hypothetical protein ACP5KG_10365 [Myxococcota bacterium]